MGQRCTDTVRYVGQRGRRGLIQGWGVREAPQSQTETRVVNIGGGDDAAMSSVLCFSCLICFCGSLSSVSKFVSSSVSTQWELTGSGLLVCCYLKETKFYLKFNTNSHLNKSKGNILNNKKYKNDPPAPAPTSMLGEKQNEK